MKKTIINHFMLILTLLVFCSGCGNKHQPAEAPFGKQETVKYKSGTILLKTNDTYNMTDQEQISGENSSSTEEVNFGPGNINFGH